MRGWALLLVAAPAAAQQGQPLPPSVDRQPFGPPPSRAEPNGAPERPRPPLRQMFRGLAGVSEAADDGAGEVDAVVTGYGNELLWDGPSAAPSGRPRS